MSAVFLRKLALLLFAFVVVGISMFVFWLNSSPVNISKPSYEIAMALLSACNQQDKTRVAKLAERIQQSQATGTLSQAEADHLLAITAHAEAGRWAEASKAGRRLLDAQVNSKTAITSSNK